MSTTMIEHQALTTADRCDRCGAQAYVRITLRNGGELLFCAHHARAHEDKLKQVALHIRMTPPSSRPMCEDHRRLRQR
ncbi:hypothetical protein [Cutibacterium acnes]|uniref:DUF7455 domain-containing protein n=1 Tax=Cutibacterium acnes TaxID=1747 RepID=UPI001F269938|nr:hypothetical protein [Cutibacterium acnes]